MLPAVKVISAFARLTRPERVNVLILDDSVIKRNRSKKAELLARVYDHVEHKFQKGFTLLTLGWSDGYSFILPHPFLPNLIHFTLICRNLFEHLAPSACLRTARRMTRQQLAEHIGLSVDALRKIETGVNGAKIDTLVSIADVFEVSLDYLVSGSERKTDTDSLLAGLKENEIQFIRNMVLNAIDNMKLLIE